MTRMILANKRDREGVRNMRIWPGETLCLKQYTADGKKYEAFGVITSDKEPVAIYLRGEGHEQTKEYPTFDAMFEDGWVVD